MTKEKALNTSMEGLQEIDIMENAIKNLDPKLLDILLEDKSSKKKIKWATNDYITNGDGFLFDDEMKPELVTDVYSTIIQPRVTKSKNKKQERTKDKAEVFTECWIVNKQNNLIDDEWFGRKGVFNQQKGHTWIPVLEKIEFPPNRTWQEYVDSLRMEVACGEGPYIVSRYNTVTGSIIPLNKRVGLLDRKLRIVGENTAGEDEWIAWAKRAVQSIYAFEYQGDNLLLARENILGTYIDYYKAQFARDPEIDILLEIANYISWNIWQMDGEKGTIPNSCQIIENDEITLFGVQSEKIPCYGCRRGGYKFHNGIYCQIYDWRANKQIKFIDLLEDAND